MPDSSREKILQRIEAVRKGRLTFIEIPSSEPIYKPILPDSVTCFKNEIEAINGVCILCENESDAYIKLKLMVHEKGISSIFCRDSYISGQLEKSGITSTQEPENFNNMEAGITGCEFLVARTGSVVVSTATQSGRQMNVFPPVHIVLAHVSQIVDYVEDAIVAIQEKYGEKLPSWISTITGPSRTADIEKTLVLGAHGPKEFIVFLSTK